MNPASSSAPDTSDTGMTGQMQREASGSRTSPPLESLRKTQSASATPLPRDDARSSASASSERRQRVADSRPPVDRDDAAENQSSQANPSAALELRQYRALFQRHVSKIFDDQRRCSTSTDGDAEATQQAVEPQTVHTVAPPTWSREEQHVFFSSLARRSRLRPDLISADLDGRKTPAQVAHYLSLLHDEAKNLADTGALPKRKRRLRYTAAAHESSAQWMKAEETCAKQIQAEEHRHRADAKLSLSATSSSSRTSAMTVSWDEQVLNASLFLRRRPHADSECTQAELTLGYHYPRRVTARVFRIAQLIAMIAIKRSDKRKKAQGAAKEEFRAFAKTHPVPGMDGKRAATKGAPAKKKPRLEPTSDEESQGTEAVAHRIVLRALELGLLMLVTERSSTQQDGQESQDLAILDEKGASTVSYKRRRVVSTSPVLPTRYLGDLLVVWSDSLVDVLADTAYPRWLFEHIESAIAKLAAITQKALDRVLSSLSAQEMHWLANRGQQREANSPAQGHVNEVSESENDSESRSRIDIPPTNQAQDPPTSDTQQETLRGRGNQSDWYRGYSLAGLSGKEKERTKARIRMRERKYGRGMPTGSRPSLEPVPASARRLGFGGQGPSRRRSVLQRFEPMLSRLNEDERKAAENRLRGRIRAWGLEETLRTELSKLKGDGRCSRRQSRGPSVSQSPLREASELAQHDALAAEPQAASTPAPLADASPNGDTHAQPDQHDVGEDAGHTNPDHVAPAHWGHRAQRFHSIGVTRSQASARISELQGFAADLFRTDTLAKIVTAMTKTQCAGGTEVESPSSLEAPSAHDLRLDAVNILPGLVEQLRRFLERLMSVLTSQIEERGAHASVVKQDVLDVLGRWDQPVDVCAWYARQGEDSASPRLTIEEQRIALANMEDDPPVIWQGEVDLEDIWEPPPASPALQDPEEAMECADRCVVISSAAEIPAHHPASSKDRSSNVHAGDVHAHSPLEALSEDEDEMFDSRHEIAEVFAIRSGWGSLDHHYKAKSPFACLTVRQRDFYWPEEMLSSSGPGPERGGHADDITDESDGEGEAHQGSPGQPEMGQDGEVQSEGGADSSDSDGEGALRKSAAESGSDSQSLRRSSRRPRRHVRHQRRHYHTHASTRGGSKTDLSSESGADSDEWWDRLDRQDELRDAAVEAKEWEFWFGRPKADSDQAGISGPQGAAAPSQASGSESEEVDGSDSASGADMSDIVQ